MSARFADLKKIPEVPVLRLLTDAKLKLETELAAPASADAATVLAELEMAGAYLDMLRVLAASLPVREAAWWACLSGRDVVGPNAKDVPATLAAAEAWVFKPGDETMDAAYDAVQAAEPDDPTVHCATVVVHSGGKLGPGALAEHEAPPGVCQISAFAMAIEALSANADRFDDHMRLIIDRGLDIAKGGSGRVTRAPEPAKTNA